MSSYKFEFDEYAWDLLYFLIMKKFNFDLEYIRNSRILFEKPIVKNIEYENEKRLCSKNRRQIVEFKPIENNNKKIICNKIWPICLNKKMKKHYILDNWGITKNNKLLFSNLIENYFFDHLKIEKKNTKIKEKTNNDCVQTAQDFFDKMLNLSTNEFSNISKNYKNKEKTISTLDVCEEIDMNEIKEINNQINLNLEKLNLKNLQIVNLNIKGEEHNTNNSGLNLVTNFDKLGNLSVEDYIDDLMIERNIHTCCNEILGDSEEYIDRKMEKEIKKINHSFGSNCSDYEMDFENEIDKRNKEKLENV